MAPREPLPLFHSWPLTDPGLRLDLGLLHDGALASRTETTGAVQRIGHWHCDLATEALTWSPEVYRLFRLPDDRVALRPAALSRYHEHSRAALERLRGYAIRHRRGFTLDVELRDAVADDCRWVRIAAAPVIEEGRVSAIHGAKLDVTHLYLKPR